MLTPGEEPSAARDRIAPNSLWMAAGAAIGVLQGIAVTFILARHLGLIAFGQLGLIVSCTGVVLFASSSSVATVLRESARARFESSMLGSAIVAQLVLAAPVLIAALAVLTVVSGDRDLLGPAAVLGLALLLRAALGPLIGFQLGRERMAWQMLESGQSIAVLVALLGFAALGTGLYALPLASLTAAVGVATVVGFVLERRLPPGSLRAHGPMVRRLVVPALLWAGTTLAQQVHFSVEPLLAPVVLDDAGVGLFIAGNRLVPALRSLAAALGLVFLPGFVRAIQAADARAVGERAATARSTLLAVGLAVAVVLFVGAPWITRMLYPPEFGAATGIMRRLAASPPAIFLHWHALCLLFAADELRPLLAGYGIALLVRLAAGLWLGAAYGAMGLATAEAISDWVLAVILQVVAFRVLALRYRSRDANDRRALAVD